MVIEVARTPGPQWYGPPVPARDSSYRSKACQFGLRAAATFSFALVTICISASAASAYVYWTNTARASFRGLPNGTTIGRATDNGRSVNPNFIRHLPFGVAGIAVDARHIYFTSLTGSGIGVADLNGKHVRLNVFHGAVAGDGALTVVGHLIYWTHADAIGRANVNGTNVRNNFIKIKQPPGGTVTTDAVAVAAGRFIFWDESGTSGGGGHIGRAAISGGGPDDAFIRVPDYANGVAVLGGHVYWTNTFTGTYTGTGSYPPFTGPPAIGRASFGGGGLDQVWGSLPAASAPGELAADAHGFYFGDHTQRFYTIGHVSAGGGGLNASFIKLPQDPSVPIGIAVNTLGPGG